MRKLENSPLLLGRLMVLSKGWRKPDDIFMPVAQFREKAEKRHSISPLLGFREIFERWKTQ